jgi:hypothetical protein
MQAKTWIPNYQVCEDCFSKVVYFENTYTEPVVVGDRVLKQNLVTHTTAYCSNIRCENHETQSLEVSWMINADPENIKNIFKKLDSELKEYLEKSLLTTRQINSIYHEVESLKANALAGDINLIKMFHLWNKKQDRFEANNQLCGIFLD